MSDPIPAADEIRHWLRADYRTIQDRGYSAEKIRECLEVFSPRRDRYTTCLQHFINCLQLEDCEAHDHIHSVRYRTKDLFHLIDKLRRKCLDADEPRNITKDNLFSPSEGLTDLGGIRILHLYKSRWRDLHRFLVSQEAAERTGCRLHDMIAYIRRDDDREAYQWVDRKRETGFPRTKIKKSVRDYTSLHYIYQWNNTDYYFECQVRTLFEEGWGEIEHARQYPHSTSEIESAQLRLLNRAAVMADSIAISLEEQFDRLPLFVPWAVELEYERSAEKVYVFSWDLQWAAKNVKELVEQLKRSETEYLYFVPKDKTLSELQDNRATVESAIDDAGFSEQLRVVAVPLGSVGGLPVFSDLLFLKNTISLRTRRPKDLAVIGTPTRGRVPEEDRLDVLIQDEANVRRLENFFDKLLSLA